jgi:hypothetical protein
MTKEEFDAAVKALRGKVVPKCVRKKKADCTPEEWAAGLDYQAATRAQNPGKVLDWARKSIKKWRDNNLESARDRCASYYSSNAERIRSVAAAYRQSNPEKARECKRVWKRKKRQNDQHYKLLDRLRTRMYQSMGVYSDIGSVSADIGCTIDELWAHLESKFQPGMTRDNWGKVWEVDHIFPLAKIKRGCRIEFLSAANWRNLQPLTPKQNRDKGDKVTPESQALFDQLKAEFAREIYAESA